jgi:hypothetical protein
LAQLGWQVDVPLWHCPVATSQVSPAGHCALEVQPVPPALSTTVAEVAPAGNDVDPLCRPSPAGGVALMAPFKPANP